MANAATFQAIQQAFEPLQRMLLQRRLESQRKREFDLERGLKVEEQKQRALEAADTHQYRNTSLGLEREKLTAETNPLSPRNQLFQSQADAARLESDPNAVVNQLKLKLLERQIASEEAQREHYNAQRTSGARQAWGGSHPIIGLQQQRELLMQKANTAATPEEKQQWMDQIKFIDMALPVAVKDPTMFMRIQEQEIPDDKAPGGKFKATTTTRTMQTAPGGNGAPPPAIGGKTLSREQAAEILKQAGGDKAKARQMAREAGYSF